MSSNKRVVTSAIDGMTVSKVRRGLDTMRRMWREQSLERPFFISRHVVDNMPMHHFALKFVMGHHYKRHNKSSGRGAAHAAEQEGGDNEDEEASQIDDDVDADIDANTPPPKRMRTRSKK